MTNSRPHVRDAVKGDAAMLGGAVLRVGRLLEASANGGAYGFNPRRAISALREIHDHRQRFRDAAEAALVKRGAIIMLEADAKQLLGGEELDKAGRAATLVPIYVFDELLVKYGDFYVRLQVAVTVCEKTGTEENPDENIARSKAWARCKRVFVGSPDNIGVEEVWAFKRAATELADAIIREQVAIYGEALTAVVEEGKRATFNVVPSPELFTILGLPSDSLQNFENLFGKLAVKQTPLRDLATGLLRHRDAVALWNLLDLLPDNPKAALESEKKLAELEKSGRSLELLPFQNSELYRGIFVWLYDHRGAAPRVDVVGFASPPSWELERMSKSGIEDDIYSHAVDTVTASLSADVGQSV